MKIIQINKRKNKMIMVMKKKMIRKKIKTKKLMVVN